MTDPELTPELAERTAERADELMTRAASVVLGQDEVLEQIATGANLQELRAMVEARGFRTLRDDGLKKVAAGLTTVEEVVRVSAM